MHMINILGYSEHRKAMEKQRPIPTANLRLELSL